MGLLAKTGLDSLKIGGHKVPFGLLAAGVGVAGVIVVLRARQQGQQVAQVGSGPPTAASTGFGLPLPASDPGAQLADISQQLTGLTQALNQPSPSVASPPATGSVVGPPIVPGPQLWNFVHGVGTPGPILTPQWGHV